MRLQLIIVTSCCFLMTTSLRADEFKPIGGPPSVGLATASKFSDGPSRFVVGLVLVHYERTITHQVQQIEVDGAATSRTVEIEKFVPVTTFTDLTGIAEVRRASGEFLKSEEILNALNKQTRVVMFRDKFDPYYADLLKPETIVIVRSVQALLPPIILDPPTTDGPQKASAPLRIGIPTPPPPSSSPTFAPSTAP